MNSVFDHISQELCDKFSSLKKSTDKQRKTAFKKRIANQPHTTDLEYLLGAFIQMYEPHLKEIVHKLIKKGYAIDPSSGFGGKNAEFQVMSGNFAIDYITRNKLEKLGVKFREYNDFNSLIFWPNKATLENILRRWMEIAEILPDHGVLSAPSMSYKAIKFRRKYIPEHINLQKQRLFEKLRYSIQKKTEIDLKRRKSRKPHPDKKELILGLFAEELEPQVRQAIFILNKKGYSTDASGFMNNPCDQMIEGDFQLKEKTIKELQTIRVQVETNPSGYTRLQFTAQEANISKIKKKWNKIASLLPDKHMCASPSMTRKARDFRLEYQ
ncbi:hypothetical protein HZB96_05455 [Candidatus Gottesmanbacteria bacterium]|nr:hypothetical protein [Candidatus Gottesmanbacteria bacterium]